MSLEMTIFLFIWSLLNLSISILNTFAISKLYDHISILDQDLEEFDSSGSEFSSDSDSEEESKVKLE